MGKTIHGIYGEDFEKECRRLQKKAKESLDIDISWREATDLTAIRSSAVIFDLKDLKKAIMKLRGIHE